MPGLSFGTRNNLDEAAVISRELGTSYFLLVKQFGSEISSGKRFNQITVTLLHVDQLCQRIYGRIFLQLMGVQLLGAKPKIPSMICRCQLPAGLAEPAGSKIYIQPMFISLRPNALAYLVRLYMKMMHFCEIPELKNFYLQIDLHN